VVDRLAGVDAYVRPQGFDRLVSPCSDRSSSVYRHREGFELFGTGRGSDDFGSSDPFRDDLHNASVALDISRRTDSWPRVERRR